MKVWLMICIMLITVCGVPQWTAKTCWSWKALLIPRTFPRAPRSLKNAADSTLPSLPPALSTPSPLRASHPVRFAATAVFLVGQPPPRPSAVLGRWRAPSNWSSAPPLGVAPAPPAGVPLRNQVREPLSADPRKKQPQTAKNIKNFH